MQFGHLKEQEAFMTIVLVSCDAVTVRCGLGMAELDSGFVVELI